MSNIYDGAFLRKQLLVFSSQLFLQKAPSQIFEKVLNTLLVSTKQFGAGNKNLFPINKLAIKNAWYVIAKEQSFSCGQIAVPSQKSRYQKIVYTSFQCLLSTLNRYLLRFLGESLFYQFCNFLKYVRKVLNKRFVAIILYSHFSRSQTNHRHNIL